jgi:ATP-dependent helicase/nuclease subunit B
MAAQVLIAPPAFGKTHTCISMLQSTLQAHPNARVLAVVRDRLQAAAFRRRLAEAGGSLGADVITFPDLYREILESGCERIPIASHTLRRHVLQKTIDRTALTYFAPLRSLPGFGRMVQNLIGELEGAMVTPLDLTQTLAEMDSRPGLREIADLYRSYRTELEGLGWTDPESLAAQALQTLRNDAGCMADLDLLVVDGFDWFDPAQRAILQALNSRARRILITLPGQIPWSRTVHRGFRKSSQELCAALSVPRSGDFSRSALCDGEETTKVVTTEEDCLRSGVQHLRCRSRSFFSHLPPPLAALEANLFEPGSAAQANPGDAICLIEARSPQEEAREALRWIKRILCETGCSPDQFAVLARDPEPYFELLRSTAVEFGLPVRFTRSRTLAGIPIVAALLDLLALPAQNYAYRPLFGVLRSPFFDLAPLGLSPLQVDTLDLISRQGKVIEGLDQWDEVFQALAAVPEDPAGEDAAGEDAAAKDAAGEEEEAVPVLPRGTAARRLHAGLRGFLQRTCPTSGSQSLCAWVTWLENLLSGLGYYPATSQEVDPEKQAALEALRDCLQDLIAAEAVLTSETALPEKSGLSSDVLLDYPAFVAQLRSALEAAECTSPEDPLQPAVTVMRMLEARGLRYPYVAVLGLSEGIFPRVERPDPILSEELRARLGLQPRLGQDQLGLFYQAITRAGRALLLTRPYLTDSGDPWEPSPYWNAVCALFPNAVRRVRPEDLRPACDAASPAELLFWSARSGATPQGPESLAERYERIRAAQARLKALLDGNGTAHSLDPTQSDPARSDLARLDLVRLCQARFGPDTVWAITRLESYLSCPFRFFVESVLQVEGHAAPEWDFDAAQLGSMLHAILERAYRDAADPSDVEQVLATLHAAANEVFAAAPAELGFRPSPLWDRQRAELLARLEATVTGLAELQPGWRPHDFELAFGVRDRPPLEMAVDGRVVRFRGVIDRVDVDDSGRVRIVDYKTGSSHLSKVDLVEGRRLQLAVYAQAAQDALNLGEPAEGLYWRIGPDGQSGLRLGNFDYADFQGPQGAMALAREHILDAVTRLEQADFSTTPLGGRCPAYCPAGGWCWKYVVDS